MSFDKIKSNAKINLSLNVTGKYSKLHKIESIISFISLHDNIFIKSIKSKKHNIQFFGKFSKNITKNNTIIQLLKLLDKKKLLNNQKFFIKVEKCIPIQAGLGGGSMNAANILKYFIDKKIIYISNKDIRSICMSIGSDVFLGFKSSNLVLTSKNKVINFFKVKKKHILIVKPVFGCSTKSVYSKVQSYNKPKLDNPKKNMFNFQYLKRLDNSLEPIVLSKFSNLRSAKNYLESLSKILFVRMTGSGSALVAYFKSKKACDIAMRQFKKVYKNYWCIVSKTI
tara:strand:+ start:1136 stop:1981 length:846 start_codon:yes stop_codon:yes gene_type:complete